MRASDTNPDTRARPAAHVSSMNCGSARDVGSGGTASDHCVEDKFALLGESEHRRIARLPRYMGRRFSRFHDEITQILSRWLPLSFLDQDHELGFVRKTPYGLRRIQFNSKFRRRTLRVEGDLRQIGGQRGFLRPRSERAGRRRTSIRRGRECQGPPAGRLREWREREASVATRGTATAPRVPPLERVRPRGPRNRRGAIGEALRSPEQILPPHGKGWRAGVEPDGRHQSSGDSAYLQGPESRTQTNKKRSGYHRKASCDSSPLDPPGTNNAIAAATAAPTKKTCRPDGARPRIRARAKKPAVATVA